jgi:hypothetical protein
MKAMVAGNRMIHGKLSENYRTGKQKKKKIQPGQDYEMFNK